MADEKKIVFKLDASGNIDPNSVSPEDKKELGKNLIKALLDFENAANKSKEQRKKDAEKEKLERKKAREEDHLSIIRRNRRKKRVKERVKDVEQGWKDLLQSMKKANSEIEKERAAEERAKNQKKKDTEKEEAKRQREANREAKRILAEEQKQNAKEKREFERTRKKRERDAEKEAARQAREPSATTKALHGLRKVVTALDGTNGRATKTVSVLVRSYEVLQEATKKHGSTTKAASEAFKSARAATAALGRASLSAATATTATTGATSGLSTALGAAGLVVGGFTIATALTVVGLKIFKRTIENLEQSVGEFSTALNMRRAQTDIALIQQQMRNANNIGGDLASLESTNKKVQLALSDFKAEMTDLIAPALKLLAEIGTKILEFVTLILKGINVLSEIIEYGIESILVGLSYIPFIGKAATKALDYMQQDDIRKISETSNLNKQIEDLFLGDVPDLVKQNNSKNFIPKNFGGKL